MHRRPATVQSQARGKLRGRAISTFLEWTGVVHEETVSMQVQADGRVFVFTAMQAMGQGCVLLAEGARRATSITSRMIDSGTGSGRKPRTE